jgi:hypothetical protein
VLESVGLIEYFPTLRGNDNHKRKAAGPRLRGQDECIVGGNLFDPSCDA